jgi:dephospho-CoA kinase
MFLVGLTGGIASGKSTVASMLGKYENEILDADEIARDVVIPGSQGLQKIVGEFGTQVLNKDGTLSRAALANVVFRDPARKKALEEILHPLIKERTLEKIAQSDSAVMVYVVPLLVEAKVDYPFDLVATIEAGTETQTRRLVENRGMTPEDAAARISAQASEAERVARADVRIDGSLDMADLEIAVSRLWSQIQLLSEKKANHGKN